MQMLQLVRPRSLHSPGCGWLSRAQPMIIVGRHPIIKRNPTLGNLFMWAGLLTGFPLLGVAYLRS
jgi:hypothetical protein